ncbi:MAG TPA: M23 family metallopeptidase [Chthoniobacteraceae bacterium]|jgi:hypothetical protein|nr:M23 family metallopeptidase [Chthoniobacteraceae bacterium]
MRWLLLSLALLVGFAGDLPASEVGRVPLADGFEIPVGRDGKSYYKARGVRVNGHLGEDWNGALGGDTDLGAPIYACADGIVVFAQDYQLGWGNVVLLRHAYLEGGETKYVDSLYGHLLDFRVRIGQIVKRGELIARMGSNRGMYDAHLHFEMRKNINVGMYRNSFPRDFSVYWDPTQFITAHASLPGGGRMVSVPLNTFPAAPPPLVAGTHVYTPAQSVAHAGVSVNGNATAGQTTGTAITRKPTPIRRPTFRVDRFEDMRTDEETP